MIHIWEANMIFMSNLLLNLKHIWISFLQSERNEFNFNIFCLFLELVKTLLFRSNSTLFDLRYVLAWTNEPSNDAASIHRMRLQHRQSLWRKMFIKMSICFRFWVYRRLIEFLIFFTLSDAHFWIERLAFLARAPSTNCKCSNRLRFREMWCDAFRIVKNRIGIFDWMKWSGDATVSVVLSLDVIVVKALVINLWNDRF